MWLDCKLIDKLINLDHVQSFDMIKNGEGSEHEYRLEIQYANVINISNSSGDFCGGSVVEDDTILEGTYDECRQEYQNIFNMIAVREKEILATMKMVSGTFGLATQRGPTEHKPQMEVSSPDIDTPKPDIEGEMKEVIEKPTDPINRDKRIRLFVMKANFPPKEGSEDMRGRKGGVIILRDIIRGWYEIKEGYRDVVADLYKGDGDLLYTISSNMAKDIELKDMVARHGFLTMDE